MQLCHYAGGGKCGAARKPNSVPPHAYARSGGDHSSATRVAAVVKQPTRRLIRKRAVPLPPYLVLLRRGFAMPSRSRGPRCALTAPFHPCLTAPRLRSGPRSAVCSLLHFPSRHRAWPLASLLPVGVRTFLRISRCSDPRAAPHGKSNRTADMKMSLVK